MARLGTERAWVVHGADGLDEITAGDKTFVAEATEGNVRTFELAPEDFGVQPVSMSGLAGSGAEENALTVGGVLSGERRDAARTLVLMNAAAALHVGGAADDLKDGMRLAEQSIDDGRAIEKLNELARMTTLTE